ncbi:NADH-quinone oxidoreductase subunit J family protein [Armatimonas rosea]|uniref:NADH-quinone oxidoreductase subunit J n=1 Tax=Armatimonas rosea TaxID=685828 RepID=A0A7W9W9W1_ARMRO|nr:NADH-quinone oxidoreductase subunit J [Armatimonas rosea]MBB6053716.1 NADH-quinone oxidoreductase subunit J [Armatimonas rosea]
MILFLMVAALALVAALLVVLNPNPVRSALFLVVNLFCIAGLYLLLNAYFLSAVQVIVYTGAIMVLFLFVIMLLNLGTPDRSLNKLKAQTPVAVLGGLLLAGALVWSVTKGTAPVPVEQHRSEATESPAEKKDESSESTEAAREEQKERGRVEPEHESATAERLPLRAEPTVDGYPLGSPQGIGKTLYNPKLPWLFPFELTSILLLIAVIGSVVLARRAYGEEATKS